MIKEDYYNGYQQAIREMISFVSYEPDYLSKEDFLWILKHKLEAPKNNNERVNDAPNVKNDYWDGRSL